MYLVYNHTVLKKKKSSDIVFGILFGAKFEMLLQSHWDTNRDPLDGHWDVLTNKRLNLELLTIMTTS
jgi:hypothetical protein